jgi:hypothetical protein
VWTGADLRHRSAVVVIDGGEAVDCREIPNHLDAPLIALIDFIACDVL